MGDITFRIEGEHAEELAGSLVIFVKQTWDFDAITKPITQKEPKAGDKDWVAGIGLVIGVLGVYTNIPGFLNSKMASSLAWRLGAKKSLDKLIAWLEKQPPEQKASIYLVVDNKEIKLAKEQLTEMLDAMQANGFGVDE